MMVSETLAQAIINQRRPDLLGEFEKGQEVTRQKKIRTLAGEALQQGGGRPLDELKLIDPEIGLSLGEAIRAQSGADINEFIRDAKIGEGLLLRGDTQGFLAFANQRSNILRQLGRDTTQTDRVRDLVASGQTQEALQNLQAFNGAIDQAKKASVQSSKILDDGTTVMIMNDGSTAVTDPQGRELSGEERAKAIKESQKFGAEISGQRAGSRSEQASLAKERTGIKSRVFCAARESQKTLREVGQIRRALEAVKTGRLAAARQAVGTLIPGVRDADAETLNSAVNEFILRRKDELLGGGVISDADIRLLQSIGPQLGNTLEANLNIISRFEEVANNNLNIARRLKKFKGDPLEFDIETFDDRPTPINETTQASPEQQTQEIKFLGFE